MEQHLRRTFIPALMGEYVSEDDLLTWSREFFLNSVWNAAPAPLYCLRDEILPRYRAVFKRKRTLHHLEDVKQRSVTALVDVVIADAGEELKSLPEYQSIRRSSLTLYETVEQLLAWSKRFNLTGTSARLNESANEKEVRRARLDSIWPVVAALETLLMWHFSSKRQLLPLKLPPMWRSMHSKLPSNPPTLGSILLRTSHLDPRANVPRELLKRLDPNGPSVRDPEEIDTPGWYLHYEQEHSFRRRVSYDFKRWLDRYVAAQHDSARAAGLVKAPGRRDLARFVWAARYQVNGARTSDLAKQYNVSKEAVVEGINWVLKLIRLEPRRGCRGPTRGRRLNAK